LENRLFLLDKNYLLKQVQSDLRQELQEQLLSEIKLGYYTQFNPLGLLDDQSETINNYEFSDLSFFDELYDILCGIYRYQIGDNQLEFLFDGRSHYDKYVEDWKAAFQGFVGQLVLKKSFILAGLELSVFHTADKRIELAQNRMKVCIYEHFGLKVYKYKGIQRFNSKQA
jgi:hypothetical protein